MSHGPYFARADAEADVHTAPVPTFGLAVAIERLGLFLGLFDRQVLVDIERADPAAAMVILGIAERASDNGRKSALVFGGDR